MNSHIVSEVERALVAEIPPCEDWTEVSIYVKLARIVARVSGRVFVGPELCHDDDYLDTGVHYTLELMECLRAVKRVRPILRSLLAPRLPETQKLRAREKRAQHILQPLVQARSEAVAKGLEKPDDLLQWLLDRSASQGYSTEQIARVQLGLTFAAIHTTTTMTINMYEMRTPSRPCHVTDPLARLYTLAAAPAYVQPLREEIRSVVEQHGGEMTTKALMKMEKLDSFMRETMRLYPLSFGPSLLHALFLFLAANARPASFMRKVLKGITLSNGQYIPAGTIIEVAQYALNQELGADFDPLRAYAMRQAGSATTSARSQFVSVSESYLGFGYGNHACPGRFFAANEIKTILAKMLLRFEVRNAGGVQERYPNLEHGAEVCAPRYRLLLCGSRTDCVQQYIPDASRKLLLKRVAV